jgi:hypothetical protein
MKFVCKRPPGLARQYVPNLCHGFTLYFRIINTGATFSIE